MLSTGSENSETQIRFWPVLSGAMPGVALAGVLATMFQPMSFEAGSVLAQAGERPDYVLVIASGEVEVREDSRLPAHLVSRGAVLGEYAIFPAAASVGTATARSAVNALALDRERFERFLIAFPESTLALLKLTVERLTVARSSA